MVRLPPAIEYSYSLRGAPPSSTAAAVPLIDYGIAATGSYTRLDSLRDAPPQMGRLRGRCSHFATPPKSARILR